MKQKLNPQLFSNENIDSSEFLKLKVIRKILIDSLLTLPKTEALPKTLNIQKLCEHKLNFIGIFHQKLNGYLKILILLIRL